MTLAIRAATALLVAIAIAPPAPAAAETGVASVYARRFHGRRTANGERFDASGLTAAHRRLPFGTRVRVTNLATRRSVVVRINDRGPFARGRVIDLSPAAAARLGVGAISLTRVHVAPVEPECGDAPESGPDA